MKWDWMAKTIRFAVSRSPWQVEKQDSALFALYQRMIALRKKGQALRRGGCQVLYAEDNVVVFVRVLNQQRVLVAINRGEACEVVLPASPLLNVAQWQRKEGHGQLTDGILALPGHFGYGVDELTSYNALRDSLLHHPRIKLPEAGFESIVMGV